MIVSDIGKILTEKDVLVLPMDVMAVERHADCFQQVIDYFGQVIQSHCIHEQLVYTPDTFYCHTETEHCS